MNGQMRTFSPHGFYYPKEEHSGEETMLKERFPPLSIVTGSQKLHSFIFLSTSELETKCNPSLVKQLGTALLNQ